MEACIAVNTFGLQCHTIRPPIFNNF